MYIITNVGKKKKQQKKLIIPRPRNIKKNAFYTIGIRTVIVIYLATVCLRWTESGSQIRYSVEMHKKKNESNITRCSEMHVVVSRQIV